MKQIVLYVLRGLEEGILETNWIQCKRPKADEETCYSSGDEDMCHNCMVLKNLDVLISCVEEVE